MKKYPYLGLIITILIITTACSILKPISNNQTYGEEVTNTSKKLIKTKVGISFEIPPDWDESKYTVEEKNLGFWIYFKNTGSQQIPFVNVFLYDKNDKKIEGLGTHMRPVTIGEWTFILSDPSYGTTSKAPDEYKTMMESLQDIQESFKVYDETKVESAYNKRTEENKPIPITVQDMQFNLKVLFADRDLKMLNSESLAILRNAIYAKYGYKFKTKEFSEYFSKLDWYKPSRDDVEELMNEVDKKNIQSILELEKNHSILVQESKTKLRSNEQDKIIGNGESFTFEVNNILKKLYIYKEPLTGVEGGNKPLKITLRIEGSQIEFINKINDGIDVYMTDFDTNDGKVDICVAQSHLDIGKTTSIYTYDGYRIEKYADLAHLGGKLLYDQKGKIYFWYSPADKMQFNYCYDYKSKESYKLKSYIQQDLISQ